MRLRIDSSRAELQDQFCQFIIDTAKSLIISKVMDKKNKEFQAKLSMFDEYINSENFSLKRKMYGVNKLDLRTILVQGASNLKYTKSKTTYFVAINPNVIVPGTFIHQDKICEMVDFGNLDIAGLRLFSKVFEEIENNIEHYIDLYMVKENLV